MPRVSPGPLPGTVFPMNNCNPRFARFPCLCTRQGPFHGLKLYDMGSISWPGDEGEREGFRPRNPAPLRGKRQPHLTIAQILRWADSHFARTKTWPIEHSGFVFENRNEKWSRISAAL